MKGIIFDLDGVIVDTARYHYLGWKKLADDLGVEFNEEKNEKLKGVGRRDSLIAMLGYTPEEDKIEEWCDLKNRYYLNFIQDLTEKELLPGALDLIQNIAGDIEWKQAIASSSKNARTILEKLKVLNYFDVIVDGTMITRSKPDPEIFVTAAEKLNLLSADVIVFEDAESGIEAAQASGLRTVGIGEKKNLPKADLVIPDLAHISLSEIKKMFIE